MTVVNCHGNFDYNKVTIYLVGGFVRDHFMGVEPKDKDYVVVGSNPQEMLDLGFTQVGTDFPVFLHHVTKDEYALARTERKTGTGYKGFECEREGVTLEEDLSRRDLTINAIALDCSRNLGKIHDPFNGRQDIKDKVLRHTTESFTEDPLRVLRVARFLSRFGDEWRVADETSWLCYNMADSGTLSELTPERVWLETVKAMSAEKPSLYFEQCLRLNLFEEVNSMYGIPQKPNHHPEVETFLYE